MHIMVSLLHNYLFVVIMTKKIPQKPLTGAIKLLLWTGKITTQNELVRKLRLQGYDVNQSKISRFLHTFPVMKVKNEAGQTIYSLPKEPVPPSTKSPLNQLILKITANETLIFVKTSPGSASLIARLLDYHQKDSAILATIAGDDTIFIAPKSVKHIQKALAEVKVSLENVEI